jgi:hypothetical protein
MAKTKSSTARLARPPRGGSKTKAPARKTAAPRRAQQTARPAAAPARSTIVDPSSRFPTHMAYALRIKAAIVGALQTDHLKHPDRAIQRVCRHIEGLNLSMRDLAEMAGTLMSVAYTPTFFPLGVDLPDTTPMRGYECNRGEYCDAAAVAYKACMAAALRRGAAKNSADALRRIDILLSLPGGVWPTKRAAALRMISRDVRALLDARLPANSPCDGVVQI